MRVIRLQRYQDVAFEHLAGQILRAEALRADGWTYRAISRDVNLPLSTLHRRLGARAAPADGEAQTAVAATQRPTASAAKAAAVALRTRSHGPVARSRQPASVRYKARAAAAAEAILRLKRPQRPLRASAADVVEAVPARGNVVTVAPVVVDQRRVKELAKTLRRRSKNTVLSETEERALVEFCLKMDAQGLGMTREMIADKVRQLCANRKTVFKNGIPGRDWWDAFLLRWPNLALRVPESLHQTRAIAEDEETFKGFFKELQRVMDEHKFLRHNVFNVDETNKNPKFGKVLSKRGKKNITIINDSRQEEHVTIVGCVSAAGDAMQPLIIYKGKKVMTHWGRHYLEAIFAATPNGWMETHVFEQWLDKFIEFVAPRRGQRRVPGTDAIADEPVLLLLDQHSSHTTIVALEKAAAHGIVVFGLVPHASHILQPLDVACFKSWHTNYGKALRTARNTDPTLAVTKEVFPQLMREPWAKALNSVNAIAGFDATGLFPLNPERVLRRFKDNATTPHDAVRPRPEGTHTGAAPPPGPPPGITDSAAHLAGLGPSPPNDETWDESTPQSELLAAARRLQDLYRRERARRILAPPAPPPAPRAKASRAGAIRADRAYSGAELLALQRAAQQRKQALDAAKTAAAAQRQAAQQERAAAKEARNDAARARAQARADEVGTGARTAHGRSKVPAAASAAAPKAPSAI